MSIVNDSEVCESSQDEDGYLEESGKSVGDKYSEFRHYLVRHGFTKIGSGSFRSVYTRKKVVVKVPRNGDGEIDNRVEDRAWHKYKSQETSQGIFLAPCRLLPNGCLMMVRVDVSYEGKIAPAWSAWIDGEQVGIRKDKWLSFDYALDIRERRQWEQEWGEISEYYNGE
jgi:hypothetical protein